MSEFNLGDWVRAKPELYDLNNEFNELISPLVEQFKYKCQALGVPYRLHFVPAQTERGSENIVELYTHSAGRCTPEILAVHMLGQLSTETLENLRDFFDVCVDKFGPEKITPDPELAKYEGDEFSIEHWLHTPQENFDCIDAYKADIEPLAKQIKELCKELRMPFYGMAVAKYEDVTAYTHNFGVNGGAERTTAEILAAPKLNPLSQTSVIHVGWILEAYNEKHGIETTDDILAKLFGTE